MARPVLVRPARRPRPWPWPGAVRQRRADRLCRRSALYPLPHLCHRSALRLQQDDAGPIGRRSRPAGRAGRRCRRAAAPGRALADDSHGQPLVAACLAVLAGLQPAGDAPLPDADRATVQQVLGAARRDVEDAHRRTARSLRLHQRRIVRHGRLEALGPWQCLLHRPGARQTDCLLRHLDRQAEPGRSGSGAGP